MIEALRLSLADRYRLDRELGAGGMATVYLAHDLKHDRDVAIKVLHPDLGAALGGERFLSEIKTTAKLQHPHILPLLDSGDANGLLYYVMPLVTGETLRARLERERQLPMDDALRIAREVADALGAAHALGIIHRDIKPENILLQGGHALVADFGIALAVQSAGGARMTQTGLSLGTPQYMSPEQAMGERHVDLRADVYALGAVTYEMVTGDPPFTGSTVQSIVAKVLTEKPTAPRAVRDTVSPQVEDTILRALAKLPADRFASAAAFVMALDGHGATAGAATRTRTADSSSARGRNAQFVVVGIACIALGFAAARLSKSNGAGTGTSDQPVLRFALPDLPDYERNNEGAGTLLRDGSGLAFIADGPQGHGIYLRSFSDTSLRYLPVTDASIGTDEMPDGSAILTYVFPGNGLSRVMLAPISGSPPRTWTDSLRLGLSVDDAGWLYGSHHARLGLTRVSPDGKVTEELTRPDSARGERTHSFPFVVGASRGVLYTVDYADGRSPTMAVFDLKSRKVTPLGSGSRLGVVGGRYLVFSSTDGSISGVRFDSGTLATAGPVIPLIRDAREGRSSMTYSVSDNGTLLLGQVVPGEWGISRVGAGAVSPWFKGSGPMPGQFRLHPDGRQVAFATPNAIDFRDIAGASRPLALAEPVVLDEFTPDGRQLFVRTMVPAGDRRAVAVRTVPVDGSAPPTLWRPSNADSVAASLMTIAVGARGYALRSGRSIDWHPSAGGASIPLGNGVGEIRLSPDGRFLAFERPDAKGEPHVAVVAIPPMTGTWEVAAGTRPRWAGNGEALYFAGPLRAHQRRATAVMKVPVIGGAGFAFGPPVVAADPPAGATQEWEIGRDGALYWLTSKDKHQTLLVVNWLRAVDSLMRASGAAK